MKRLLKLVMILAVLGLLFPSITLAKKKTAEVEGSGPRTFRKVKTLPGPIKIDFSIVTLAAYQKEVDQVFDYTFSETERIATHFLGKNSQSDLARVAASSGVAPVTVSKETLVLATHAKEVAEWSRGAFDPVKGAGSYKNLKINKKKSTVYLTKTGSTIELGGILEGFMADLFIRAAYHANIDDALVTVNGVMRAIGRNAYEPWKTMISADSKSNAKRGMSIIISNYSAATVGGNERAPTINPRNGEPLVSPYYSVTVLTKQAATAEAIASAVYTMNEREGEILILALGIRAIIAYPDGNFKKIGHWSKNS